MTKKPSKEDTLKAVKTLTEEISNSSLEKEALEAVRTLILWAGDDPESEGLIDLVTRRFAVDGEIRSRLGNSQPAVSFAAG